MLQRFCHTDRLTGRGNARTSSGARRHPTIINTGWLRGTLSCLCGRATSLLGIRLPHGICGRYGPIRAPDLELDDKHTNLGMLPFNGDCVTSDILSRKPYSPPWACLNSHSSMVHILLSYLVGSLGSPSIASLPIPIMNLRPILSASFASPEPSMATSKPHLGTSSSYKTSISHLYSLRDHLRNLSRLN